MVKISFPPSPIFSHPFLFPLLPVPAYPSRDNLYIDQDSMKSLFLYTDGSILDTLLHLVFFNLEILEIFSYEYIKNCLVLCMADHDLLN